jgi:hypothetical protein
MAHAYGPRSRRAMQALKDVDHAIEQLWRVIGRVPEHRYDAYILSDHCQTPCTPYRDLMKGGVSSVTVTLPADIAHPMQLYGHSSSISR